ncbi:unnamed protein product [Cylicocyclus nassatus]|uniref:Metalloendopeptidase n=1 Tax=Cylicocyclus nassatus TaxID=53992 RepID=A0AA36GZT1_CYLNA|nr:unnamed protein product [Cylicocyclus nassatus]
MLYLLFEFALLATTPNNNSLPGAGTRLPAPSLHRSFAASLQNVRSSQSSAESDGANKRRMGAVKHSHFKGLALRPDEWARGLWPGGEIPYEISPSFTYQELSLIQWAMIAFHKHTCIRFRPRTPNDMYYLSISKNYDRGCWSDVGRATTGDSRTPEGKFKTETTFQSDCLNRQSVIHELMHIIGFYHEHQREDRDPRISAGRHNPDASMDYWTSINQAHSMLYLVFEFALLATAANDNSLPGPGTHLPAPAASLQDIRSSQLSAESDGVHKRSVGAVKYSRFKGLALSPNEWAKSLWPRGEVPYEILPNFTFQELSVIKWGMDAFHKHTCIRFPPRTPSNMYYLSISKNYDRGCWSDLGRVTTDDARTSDGRFKTKTTFKSDCLKRQAVLHELMHIIGFYHEHQREDRDPRITTGPPHPDPSIDYWNRHILPRTSAHYMGKYDPESVMHYRMLNFKNYEREFFSQSDIDNINKLYKCPQTYKRS